MKSTCFLSLQVTTSVYFLSIFKFYIQIIYIIIIRNSFKENECYGPYNFLIYEYGIFLSLIIYIIQVNTAFTSNLITFVDNINIIAS